MPVRKIPIGHNSITGRFSLAPGKAPVGFESTLERDFIRLMAFDPDVTDIEEQPVRIDYQDDEGRPHHYTPDYLVQRRNAPPLLAEIKPRKFLKSDLETKFEAARLYAADQGWVFEVWTERELRTPRLDNIHFLERFMHEEPDPDRAARILKRLDELGPMSGDDAIGGGRKDEMDRAIDLGVLWQLIASGQLHADLNQELTEQSILHRTRRVS